MIVCWLNTIIKFDSKLIRINKMIIIAIIMIITPSTCLVVGIFVKD